MFNKNRYIQTERMLNAVRRTKKADVNIESDLKVLMEYYRTGVKTHAIRMAIAEEARRIKQLTTTIQTMVAR